MITMMMMMNVIIIAGLVTSSLFFLNSVMYLWVAFCLAILFSISLNKQKRNQNFKQKNVSQNPS